MNLITDAELGAAKLDDHMLVHLEFELRTGGNVNIRQCLKAILELQELRKLGIDEFELQDLRNDLEAAKEDAARAEALCDTVEELNEEIATLKQQLKDAEARAAEPAC